MVKHHLVHYEMPGTVKKEIIENVFERPKFAAAIQTMYGRDYIPDSLSPLITTSNYVIIGDQKYGTMESRQKRSCWVLAYSFDAMQARLGLSVPRACKVWRYIEVTCKVSGTLRKNLFADIIGLGHHQHDNHFPLPTTVWSLAECDGSVMFLPVDLFICQLAHTISKVKFNHITQETVAVVTPIPTTTISQATTGNCLPCLTCHRQS